MLLNDLEEGGAYKAIADKPEPPTTHLHEPCSHTTERETPFDTPLGDTTPLDKTIWTQRKTLGRCPLRAGETYERVVSLPSWMGRDRAHC